MWKNKFLLFGMGLVAGVTSSLGFKRVRENNSQNHSVLPIFYAGTWRCYDRERDQFHVVTISPKFELEMDHQTIPANVQHISADRLVYLDKFGYHIVVKANQNRPTMIFDEADNREYQIEPVK